MEKTDTLLTVQEVSALTQVPVGTFYGYRTKGGGPRALKVGRHLRYRREDVERWLDEQSSDDGRATATA